MIKVIYFFIALAIISGVVSVFIKPTPVVVEPVLEMTASTADSIPPGEVICTMDAMECPDGSFVGRTGPKCEFVCPEPDLMTEAENELQSVAELITLSSVSPDEVITSPLKLNGEARGTWYFEASFPVVLTNWDGLIIAEGNATAEGDWMTEEFVPFTASLDFENPYTEASPEFMKRGTLILKKDNPSGLPQHDNALEIPVRFAP
jgi:hypothetical protein